VSHSWTYRNDDYSDEEIELTATADNLAGDDGPHAPLITTNLSFDAFDEASANGILLDACAAEILRLDDLVKYHEGRSFDNSALAYQWRRSHDALLALLQEHSPEALLTAKLPSLPSPEGTEAIGRMDRRIKDLEAVISERGSGTPEPTEIDREAFEALDPEDRFAAFLEAAGWALEARRWEKRAEELEAHQDGIRKTLRIECGELGDNGWPDELHLGDVIEKHLCRPAAARIAELEATVRVSGEALALAEEYRLNGLDRIAELEAELARIRRELEAWAEEFMRRGAYLDSFLEALDGIIPKAEP
jgi:hypothetical protein